MSDQEYVMRLKMEGGRPVVTMLNEVGSAGEKNFAKVHRGAGLANVALASVATRLAGAFTFVAAARAVSRLAADLDALGDTAERIGITTRELQELRSAAVEAGEETSVLDGFMMNFASNLGAAQQGTGKLLAIFKDYNIELKDAQGRNRSTTEVLRDFAEAVRGASTEQERLNLLAKAGGEEGKKLGTVFRDGAAGLDEFAKRAHENNRVIDERYIASVDRLDRKFKDLMYSGKVYVQNLLAGDVHELFMIMDGIAKHAQETSREFQVLLDAGRRFMISANMGAGDAIGAALAADAARGSMGGLLAGGAAGMPRPTPKPSKFTSGHDDATKEADQLKKVVEQLQFRNEQMGRTNEQQELYNQLKAAGVELDSAGGKQIQKLVEEYNKLAAAQKEEEERLKRSKEAAEALTRAYNGFFDRIIDGFEDGKITAEEFGQAVMQLAKEILLAQGASGQTIGAELFSSIGSGFSDFFASIFHDGGIAGGRAPSRRVPASVFADAPRLHGGGMIGPGEVPAILRRGEGVFTEEQMAALSAGSGAQVNVHVNNYEAPAMQATARPVGNNDVMVEFKRMARQAVGEAIRAGEADSAMAQRYGVSPRSRN